MGTMDEDTADSRTIGVGRKRDLQDATQSQDGKPAKGYDFSDEEHQRLRKRAKHSQESLIATGSEDRVIINTASPLPPVEPLSGHAVSNDPPSKGQEDSIPAPGVDVDMVDALANDPLVASTTAELLHAAPAAQTESSALVKGVTPMIFSNEGESSKAPQSDNPVIRAPNFSTRTMQDEGNFLPSLANTPLSSISQNDVKQSPLPGWNGGIQSELRTSFGSKNRISSIRSAPSFGGRTKSQDDAEDYDASSKDDVEDSVNNSSEVGTCSLTQAQTIAGSVPLSKHERAFLPVVEQHAHKAAHKVKMKERRLQTWTTHTMQAEKALAQEKTWPLSNGSMLDMINGGKTFYARDVPKPLKYSNESGNFDLSPVWDQEGKPIKAQDFSFNRFAPAFISKNLDKAANLNMHDLQLAFHAYCKKGFYRHLGSKCQPLMDTANADNVLTLEQALELGGVRDHHRTTPSNDEVLKSTGLPSSVRDPSQNDGQFSVVMRSTSDPCVVLSDTAKGQHSPSELAVYEKRLEDNQRVAKEASVRAATEEADRIIKLTGRWPLPNQYRSISDSITKGHTFYARTPKNQKPYKKGGVEYPISQIYDEGGIPFKAESFSFNMFVVAFLKQNPGQKKWNTITIGHLKGAFGFYCSNFYNAVSQPILAQTARAQDALTLEQAMKLASQTSQAQKTMVVASKPIERRPPESQQQMGTESSTSANTFPQEIESQTGQHQNSSQKKGVYHHQKAYADHGQAEPVASGNQGGRMVTLKQLANGTNQVQPGESSVGVPDASKQSKDISQLPEIHAESGNNTPMHDTTPLPSRNRDKGKWTVRELKSLDEVLLQQKYFPSTDTTSDRCLACAGIGHGSSTCPALECTLCGMSGDHSNFMCAKKTRCQKCRQRGHQTSACLEKLSLSTSEAIPCDICGSKEHLEIACHFVWRSFAPGPEVQKVQAIPVHCYTCGGSGHYGPECGILARSLQSGKVTWSQSNTQRYLDPISRNKALSAGIDYSIPKSTK